MPAGCSRLPSRPGSLYSSKPLPVVAVAPGRCVHRGTDRHPNARQDPRTLARGKERCQESVIDFPRYREPVEQRRREEQPFIVREAVSRGVDVTLRGGDDSLVIPGHAFHLGGIGVEQPLLEISDLRFEGSQPLVDVEIDFVGEAARNAALAEFALRIDVAIKLVRIARQVGIVTDHLWFVLLTARSRAGNDRLQLADLAVLEGVGSLPEIVREAARERVKRVRALFNAAAARRTARSSAGHRSLWIL